MKLKTKPTGWRRICIACIVLLTVFIQPLCAQQKLPLIKATSKIVDIKDGDLYQKAIWNLSPEIKPDVYYALHPVLAKKIIFYTDLDSISFDINPGSSYDFIILLNGKDSCYTRISTTTPALKTETSKVSLNTMEPALLKQDFTLFRNALQQEHAGLYRYESKAVLDNLFDSCQAALDRPMSQLAFAKSIMFMVSAIEDGHTGTNIPRLLMNQYGENEKMFPAYVFFINKKAYVLCSRIKELSAGTEILSIENKMVSEIRHILLQYLPSDGKIETKKQQTLNNGAFPFLYNWIFGNKDSFAVKYKTKEGKIKSTNIHAEFLKDFECDNGNDSNTTKDLQLDFLQENTALLTVKTFDDNRLSGKQDFRDFLNTSFKEINSRKADKLTIDLRRNAGGTDAYGALLYSYLTNKPFKYFSSIESTTAKITLKENPLLGFQQPQENSFPGEVYFLISGLSFSTTADFCAIAKSNNRGKFIGEETGGGYYGNTSGTTTRIELTNSQIEIIIPKFKYVNDVKKSPYKDRGVNPDYIITPTIDDVISHKDVQLNFAIKLAQGK
ncbi:S41 family peptidase [Danxiaibacter flavus]|uniref:S41 family peptidase n=1 Tax=Danxiaibacter flavus TaxID=3049108 RepID=A0ABV3ZJW2_9BACT|nr:S41 family peptidase [Chitinophagaceae bacterium DXS]